LSYFETTEGVLGISFVSDITEQKDNQRELQALTARLLGIQEGGNKELSRELHDGLSQKIAALGMEVSMLLQRPDQAPGALPDRVRALSERINDLSADVHAMSRRLHPAILTELGLEAAVREECVGFSAQERVPAHFASESVPPSLRKACATSRNTRAPRKSGSCFRAGKTASRSAWKTRETASILTRSRERVDWA
jgi:signal transduction histidine kinase